MMKNKVKQHSFVINYIIWFNKNCLYEKHNNLSLRMESHILNTNISMYDTILWWINNIIKRHSKKIIVIPLKKSLTAPESASHHFKLSGFHPKPTGVDGKTAIDFTEFWVRQCGLKS